MVLPPATVMQKAKARITTTTIIIIIITGTVTMAAEQGSSTALMVAGMKRILARFRVLR
jgi:hypothetical protein